MSYARALRDAFNNQLLTFEEMLNKAERGAVYKKNKWSTVCIYRFADESDIQLEIRLKRISHIGDAQEGAKRAKKHAEKRDKYTPISYAELLYYSKMLGEIAFDELLLLVEEQSVETGSKHLSPNVYYTFEDSSQIFMDLKEKRIASYSGGDSALVLKKRLAHPALNGWSTEILTKVNIENIFNKFYVSQQPEPTNHTHEIYYQYTMEKGIYTNDRRIKTSMKMTTSGDYDTWVESTVLDLGAKLSAKISTYLKTIRR